MVSRLLFTEPQLMSGRREGVLVVLVHSSKAGVLVLLPAASSETLSSIIMKRRGQYHESSHVSFMVGIPLLSVHGIQQLSDVLILIICIPLLHNTFLITRPEPQTRTGHISILSLASPSAPSSTPAANNAGKQSRLPI